jgi:hypothetical protein
MGRNDNNAKAVGAGEVPKAQQVSKPRMSTEEKVERLLQEINMLNLERFLFSTDRQNAAGAHTERIFTDSEGRKYTFVFGKFGQPGEVAYRVFHAGTHHFVESARMCDGNACHFRPLAAISKRRLAAARMTMTTTKRSCR